MTPVEPDGVAENSRPMPSLALVIPVWNLPDELKRLLLQAAEYGIFSEIIISDDASDPPCSPEILGIDVPNLGARVTYLRSKTQKGAGHARNLGLSVVKSEFVLFFDADDLLHDFIVDIWSQLCKELEMADAPILDFAIFRHSDTRIERKEGRQGTFNHDEKIWNRCLNGKPQKRLTRLDSSHLAGIAAYPWNKIYRTRFLRDNDIKCSETPVHNDMALHWLSFTNAKNVLAMDVIGATHTVEDGAHHLTNRRGAERLCLFDILPVILADIRKQPDCPLFISSFISFALTLCIWVVGRVDSRHTVIFADHTRQFFQHQLTEAEFNLFAIWQPEKANRLTQILAGREKI